MADQSGSVIGWIIAGGGGTLIGSVVTAFIQTLGSRGKDRAAAADVSVGAATRMMDRLERENTRMREAIIALTDVLDELITDVDLSASSRAKLREANNKAKLAV